MSGCVIWGGRLNRDGYGVERTADSHDGLVHRLVYEEVNGPIPEGMVIMHTCDARACVNLEHLRLGTHADNQRDKAEKGRAAAGEDNGRSKLTAAEVADIRELKKRLTVGELAQLYKVDGKTIRKALSGETWCRTSAERTQKEPGVAAPGSFGTTRDAE